MAAVVARPPFELNINNFLTKNLLQVRKGLEALYKKMEKHMSDEENLLQVMKLSLFKPSHTRTDATIGRVHEYPTMHYFGIPRHPLSTIAYKISAECFWKVLVINCIVGMLLTCTTLL